MRQSLSIDTKKEVRRIEKFIQDTLAQTKKQKIIIACSGGVDSSVSAALCVKAVGIRVVRILLLPYGMSYDYDGLRHAKTLANLLKIPAGNVEIVNIAPFVNIIKKRLAIATTDKVRLGNVMARARMIVLYDRAKKDNALVSGTENKSEHLLGYFTRFGDEASDFEPIRHLYKTQVYQLAKHLKLPAEIIVQQPTAGLWTGQTDEEEFGFSYKEADNILHLYYDRKLKLLSIIKKGFSNAKKVIEWSEENSYKHHVPYEIAV